MYKLDYQETEKHLNILNVAYHLCLDIREERGYESKAICPFCGYQKLSKIPTLSLNSRTNKYCCTSCGNGGYSIGLYAKVRHIDNKTAFKELLEKQCYSMDREKFVISPVNELADVEIRDRVYREFLGMLKLEQQHKKYLQSLGFLESSIEDGLYRTAPKNYIKRRLLGYAMSKKFNLARNTRFLSRGRFQMVFK